MKYAISSEERVEATPGEKGVCPSCGSEMIAKCGDQKIWHWAQPKLAGTVKSLVRLAGRRLT